MAEAYSGALDYTGVQAVLDPSTLSEEPDAIQMLSINSTSMSVIPDSISLFKNLSILRLIDNPLTGFPNIFPLKNLELLYIVRCGLTEVPDEITELSKLRLVNFTGNQITKVSPRLFTLPSIVHIILDNNKLTRLTIPGDVDVTTMHLGLMENPLLTEDLSLEELGVDGLSELFGANVTFTEEEKKAANENKTAFQYKAAEPGFTIKSHVSALFVGLVGFIIVAVGMQWFLWQVLGRPKPTGAPLDD